MKQFNPSRLTGVFKWTIPLLLTFHISCHKESIRPKPLSGTFLVREVPPNPDFLYAETYDTDSLSTPEAEFIANEPDTNGIMYRWYIGTDTRVFTRRKFTLDFATTADNHIDARLLVIKSDPVDPSKNDTAFSRRTFYLRRRSQVTGTFEGYFQGHAQKVILKIQDDFKYPMYDSYHDPEYKGLLITSNFAQYDSLFISSAWSAYQLLHCKLYMRKTPEVNYELNKRLLQPEGVVTYDIGSKQLFINIQATSIATNNLVTIKYAGMKQF